VDWFVLFCLVGMNVTYACSHHLLAIIGIENSFQLLPLQQLSFALQDNVQEQLVGGAQMPEMP
jgi:hypothetical protein